ncbi:Mitochondrial inner membrane translocase subunit Tim17/Tim22/Tim23/peroxisomal protein PMP24 [Ostreococcus tauri]|uniref:Mitochondrial inner membrane translocase subunit Tim17/Tim22/Tim23/peroxisomal protein PMP24 n=1 Tax=Ostreococcus tauri TaxID=70448 RepID=Q01CW2_OSTTA|nr:Mitochondrial inner membrane translocase subunit Tim17/Tim22/Tim23/peroxisomal protein PMP24 [Ostreococcus tauri]OUS43797.1 putative mitochondrial inner membrane protein [Ostreococcus tauri]CAL52841.1 Mitochondrial inner membrane translocase subunit Tim17/Tim22/Tim23/peroxisomal protein PMP24 [Ostreococcus tauri]|eukprot:XP_003078101.1 Mitochondrial inner membrane translocase subunit Tim17/Tim22/Tim23/peroxisomal protein PMP24 [Ostreococcus tauri]
MGLRDLLGVRRGDKGKNEASSSGTMTLDDTAGGSASNGALNENIEQPNFGAPAENFSLPASPSGSYNPYSGLGGPFDPSMSKSIYSLADTPEYLFDEERTMKTRSWSENLTYLTGVGYLSGSIAGGGWGLYGSMKATPDPTLDTSKLRLNRMLNAVSQRGRSMGNTLGCIGLYYAALESASMAYTENRYDSLCSVFAGGGAGALYKSMSGPRAIAVYGAGGALLSAMNVAAQGIIGR